MRRIKGARDLVFDSIVAVTDLVQKTHTEVSNRWTDRASMIEGVEPIARSVNAVQLTGAAANYAAIRLVSRGIGAVVKAVTDPFLDEDVSEFGTPMRRDAAGSLPWWIDHAEGTLNGFFGSHLARSGNGLDLGMTLRHDGTAVTAEQLRDVLSEPTSKVCVFVHGLSATEWSWVLYAQQLWGDPQVCYGTKLREDLGYTPLYVRYNSGRHVSDNGQALADLLDTLHEHYPVPINQLALVGHSMGGLVARSAAHQGASRSWAQSLKHVFCIGSPHLGAPLEKGAHVLSSVLQKIPAAGASVPAAMIDARSDGIKDLRHGYTIEPEWRGEDATEILHDNRHNVPLADGVSYYAVAATITADPEHPAGRLLGDLLVRVPSASGEATQPERRVAFHSSQVFAGMNHLHLANHPAVYEVLRACLEPDEDATGS